MKLVKAQTLIVADWLTARPRRRPVAIPLRRFIGISVTAGTFGTGGMPLIIEISRPTKAKSRKGFSSKLFRDCGMRHRIRVNCDLANNHDPDCEISRSCQGLHVRTVLPAASAGPDPATRSGFDLFRPQCR